MSRFKDNHGASLEAALEHAADDAYTALDNEPLDEDAAWLREQRITNKSLHWLKRPLIVLLGLCIWLASASHACGEGTRQALTFKLACNAKAQESGACDLTETQLLVSKLQQYYGVCSGIMTTFALGKVGPLLDQYGRKVFLLMVVVSLFSGKLLRYLVMAGYLTLQFKTMVLAEVLQNIGGGIVCYVTLAACYVSDIAELHQRTYYLGINMAALFLGFSIGPLVGNALLELGKKWNPDSSSAPGGAPAPPSPAELANSITPGEYLPMKVELGLFFVLMLLLAFVLPESRSEKARHKSQSLSRSLLVVVDENSSWATRGAAIVQKLNFLRPLRIIFYPKDAVPVSRHQSIRAYRTAVVALVFTECILVLMVIPLGEVFILYGIWRFKWGAKDIGHLLAVSSTSRAFVLIVLSPIIHHKFFENFLQLKVHQKYLDSVDFGILGMSFWVEIVGLILLSMASSTPLFLVTLVFCAFSALAGPALNSSIVKFYPQLCIGEVFGGMALIKNTLSIVMPLTLLALYKYSLKTWQYPQLVFWFTAASFVAFFLAISYAKWVLNRELQYLELMGESLTPTSSTSSLIGTNSSNSNGNSNSNNKSATAPGTPRSNGGVEEGHSPQHSRNASFSHRV